MYANLDDVDLTRRVPVAERPEVDRWALARLEATVATATEALDAYDAQRAGAAIEAFVDELSNWYVRLNRRRFWKAASGDDKQSAYLTLYECLDTVHRLMAPFVPFLSEAIYQNLVRSHRADAPVSVHMSDWPEGVPARVDPGLLAETEVVQRVVGLGRSARNASKLKVRQPLSRLLVRVPDEAAACAVRNHEALIRDELNVKSVELIPRDAGLVTYRIKPNLPVVGKRYGKRIPAIRKFLQTANGVAIAAAVARGETQRFTIDGEVLEFEPAALLVETESAEGFACAEEHGYLAGLDTSLDEELVREGTARELIRIVQDGRKQAELEVSDRIELFIQGGPSVQAAVAAHQPTIMAETLSSAWSMPANEGSRSVSRFTGQLGDDAYEVYLARVEHAANA
jgi:isoleucyl-tRNA synthetase